MARILVDEPLQVGGLATVGKRTSGIEIRHKHLLPRRQNFRRLAHEVHSAADNHVGIRLRSLLCQRQTVADEIGYSLHLVALIVVRQDDCILLFLQFGNLFHQIQTLLYRSVNVTFIHSHYFIYFLFIFFKKEFYVVTISALITVVTFWLFSCFLSY